MQQYKNSSGKSGVSAFEIGDDYIKVQFKDGSVYLYNSNSTGSQNIQKMKSLAINGEGLNGFISTHIKKKYASKLR